MNVRQNQLYKKQREIVIANNDICGVCGFPVDKKQLYNIKVDGVSIVNPISATVDHIVPIAKGGSVTDINNLQLAHYKCNNAKRANFAVEYKAKTDHSDNDWARLLTTGK